MSRDWAFLVAQRWRTFLPMQESQVPSLVWEYPLEEGMATHSSILAWKIPGTEEPGRLQSIRLQRVRHDWAHSHLQRLQNKILSWPKISLGFFCNILWKTSNKLFLANPIYHYKKCSCKHFENKFFMFPNETLKLGNHLHILQMTQLSSERQRFGPSSYSHEATDPGFETLSDFTCHCLNLNCLIG